MSTVAAVAIGRNEGDRLKRCLTSLHDQGVRLVYVDSGSTDGSVAFARSLGAMVVELDTSVPFTAARARNAGFDALVADGLPDLVQFVDGDCGVESGWIAAAQEALDGNPRLGLVTGWRTEIDADASIYNAMCEVEWHRPPGDIRSCGGDMMVRATEFRRIGGFDPRIIASEDEEFCLRLREETGLRLVRLPRIMTRHDAAMLRFGQWWRRAIRSGHGFAEVGFRNPPHFRGEILRVLVYGAALPLCILVALLAGLPLLALAGVGLYALSWWRTQRGLQKFGLVPREARRQAGFLTLSKFPNLIGMILYGLRRARQAEMRLIEYK